MKTIDRISVLITAYKNAELVRRCVDSLACAFGGELPEVVIVDDDAGDAEIRELAESYAKRGVKFAVMPKNGGFAGANNFGYLLCTKEFPVLVNSDIVFREEPFTAMLKFMDEHPKAGIVQGTLIIKNGQEGVDGKLNGCGSFLTPLGTTSAVGWLKPEGDAVAKEARQCFAAYGAMFMIRRAVVESTGRLFYDFFHSYYEEVDFCHRAWLVGWESWYVPTPSVAHQHGATFGKYVMREEVLRRFYRNIRFSFKVNFGWRGRSLVKPVFECCCLAQSLLQLAKGKGMAFRAHLWAHREIRKLRPEIREARRRVQATRTQTDGQLFARVMRHYTWRELLAVARGNV